jgi:hypothetical protein
MYLILRPDHADHEESVGLLYIGWKANSSMLLH